MISHFVNGPVTIEFQSVLNTSYEISNCIHISDVVSLTRDLVSDLNSVLIRGQLSDFSERNSEQDKDNSSSSELLAIGIFSHDHPIHGSSHTCPSNNEEDQEVS